ncbi:MAG: hypothetical protein KME60_04185 [Cyanomargarita calcarea GSE-NOS-MK-12-04C]|jgi:hypothetical protein|uniref:Uncharacterized protein n=1 Tax=Cyanomargarita calcarea GSE-NOS-MK-12-04C TaxID=2839659 RepID=A0A951QIG7_9CYAN|nr:hypothetical protein [Cyanomargarita calcarea GSE-NOS-MK-12-04C]
MLTKYYLANNPFKAKACYLASLIGITAIVANTTPAAAVEMIYRNPGNVSKIQGLVLDGINYDVTFKYDSFLNLFGSPNSSDFNRPTFWDNSQIAKKAVDNIASLMNSQQPVPTKVNSYPSALLPYRGVVAPNGTLFLVSKVDSYITRWDNFIGESQDIFTQGNEQANYAIFSVQEPPKTVPESNLWVGAVVTFLLGATFNKYEKGKANQD